MKKAKKALAILLCAALLVGGTIAGTVAYLTAKTGPVTNTFTAGNVAITLDELDVDNDDNKNDNVTTADGKVRDTANSYNLIPGETYVKDPTVHVAANSETSWIFVKVENGLVNYEAANGKTIAEQIEDNGWELVSGTTNVYSQKFVKDSAKLDYVVFEEFTINSNQVLGDIWSAVASKNITVTAYAVQASNGNGEFTAAQAWAQAWAQAPKA